MIAIRLSLLAFLLALAAVLAAPARAATPLRGPLPVGVQVGAAQGPAGQDLAVRATPAPVMPAEVARRAR